MLVKSHRWAIASLFFFRSLAMNAQLSPYPLIGELRSTDPAFCQWQNALHEGYKASSSLPLLLFAYKLTDSDTFFSVCAKMNGWQATLATLNAFSSSEEAMQGQIVLLTNKKGIFIYDPPCGALQQLLMASRDKEEAVTLFIEHNGLRQKVYFFDFEKDKLAGDFQSSERFFFLDPTFSFPLKEFILSSEFGWRKSPISGRRVYHKGIDLAAPYGTLAYPARCGTVVRVSYNEIYGHYVLIEHTNGYQSLYGHFRKVLVKEGEKVSKKQAIGEVGDTGMATGPHLHFEIHKRGAIQNPSTILRRQR